LQNHLKNSSEHKLSEQYAIEQAALADLITLEEEWTQKDPRLATLRAGVMF